MNIEKLKRLQVQVRIGGKGTPRRKKKVMHQTAAADDKKLQSSLKKLSVSTIPGIEEVNIIKDDLTVIHFNNPKAQASLSANTFAVTGHGETKKIVEMLPEILPQLGQETVVQLRMFANSMTKNQKEVDGFEPNILGSTDEDDVPLLVNDFDEIAKKEDLSKGQIQNSTKGSALNAEIITTHESTPIQSTEKYSKSENKPTDTAIAVAVIEHLQSSENVVKTEKDVKKDNIKKIEIRNQSDNTKKATISGNVKEGHVKKEHNKPKSKTTDSHPTSSQLDSIKEPVSEFNEKKGTDVPNITNTTEKCNAGTNVKEANVNKEGDNPKNKLIDGSLNPLQYTTADSLMEPLHTPKNNKIAMDIKKDNTKKSEKNNTKKTTEGGNAEDNIKKESIKLKHKVTETVTSSISQQQNENNKLLPTKELKQDIIKTSDKSLDMNVVPSSKVPNLENVPVTGLKGDQLMISNAQPNKNQIYQTKTELNQENLIESNLIDNSLLFMDSNAEGLEISNKDMQQEQTNVTILSLEHDKEDSHVADTVTASSCNPEGNVEQLKVTFPSTVFNEELKKGNSQEIQDVLDSINNLENTIKNVAEFKDAIEPTMGLLTLENLEKKIDRDENQCETITNIVIEKKSDVQEADGDVSTQKLETKIKNVEILQNVVIPGDAKLCLEKKKADDPKVFDPISNQLVLQHTKETQIKEMLDTSLIEIAKQIKDVDITQDPSVSLQFVQEKLLAREKNEEVLDNLENIKTQPDDVKITKDLLKTIEEPNLVITISTSEELEKQTIEDKPQLNIDANLTAKSNMRSPTQKKGNTKKDTGKPQLASTINPALKKPDHSARPKQVSPPKSHVQLLSPTGTTPKTQQASKSAVGSTSVKQEKPSVAPKPKQTLSASIKSQATATASKSLTTKKSSVSPPSSDSAAKNRKIKASSAPEMSHVACGTKKSKPQSVATTVEQKVAEDPPKPSQ